MAGKFIKDPELSAEDSMKDRTAAKAQGNSFLLQSKHFGAAQPSAGPKQMRKGQPDGLVGFAEGKAKGMIGG